MNSKITRRVISSHPRHTAKLSFSLALECGHARSYSRVVEEARCLECERKSQSLPKDDPRSYIGRGYESIPGKPFGYAHMMEKTAIRNHLIARGYDPNDYKLSFRVTRVQERIHKYKPTFAEKQRAARAVGTSWITPKPTEDTNFTDQELQHLVDLFTGANDPVSVAIAEKARLALEKML